MTFELIEGESKENRKFKAYANSFKVRILEPFESMNGVHRIFKELIRVVGD